MSAVAGAMAGLAIFSSLFNTRKVNQQMYRQQLQIIGDTKSAYVGIENAQKGVAEKTGIALTQTEFKTLKDSAKNVATKASRNTAGISALYSYANFLQQKSFTKGSIIKAGEDEIFNYGEQAKAKFAAAKSGWNQAEAKKIGTFEAILLAASAGAQGYAVGKSI